MVECTLRMNHLNIRVAYIYGIISIFASLFAVVSNTIVLCVLWLPNYRTKSNKILTSLAISDTLVGGVLLPIFAGQLLSTDQLSNCAYDYAREYITTVTIGSSLMALGLVAYDRYILISNVGAYNRIMSKRKIDLLITASWVFPAVSPVLRFLGKGPFLYCVIVITLGPLVVLMLTYYKIMKSVQQSSSRISEFGKDKTKGSGRRDELKIGRMLKSTQTNKSIDVTSKRLRKRNIKFAKAVGLLILTYCMCLMTSSVWSICDLVNESNHFTSITVIQNLYVFACFTGSMNSCFNPIIYFLKQPGVRKGVYNLFRVKRDGANLNDSNMNSSSNETGMAERTFKINQF